MKASSVQPHIKSGGIKPDPQFVYEAERITNAANVHRIRMALKWYEHWCAVGNEAVAEVSTHTLRAEICKAWKNQRPERDGAA